MAPAAFSVAAACALLVLGGHQSMTVQPPAARCGEPHYPANALTLHAGDGVRLEGAEVGKGTRGVVLVHEAGSKALCGWWPYAVRLARRGFHVLLFDMRCYGLSACPGGSRSVDTVADVAAAVARLRAFGAQTIELVGGSYGGSVALVAAARLPRIAALADLSGDELTAEIGGAGGPITAVQAAAKLRAPVLFAVAKLDRYVSVAQVRSLYRRARSRVRLLRILPAKAGHGWDLLFGTSTTWSPFERTLTGFLAQHARP
jgi:pimeloyl-ACP methyl ester carboxylesterase